MRSSTSSSRTMNSKNVIQTRTTIVATIAMMMMLMMIIPIQQQLNSGVVVLVGADATDNDATSINDDNHIDTNTDMTSASQSPEDIESIVTLTDETFEHMTQASTGLTTGSWLIWFYNSTITSETAGESPPVGAVVTVRGTYPTTEQWLDHYIVVAKVDVGGDSIRTKKRFFDLHRKHVYKNIQLPTFVFIHNKGNNMYYIPTQEEIADAQQQQPQSYYDWEVLYTFCTSLINNKNIDTVTALAVPIPPPQSIIDEVIEKLANNPRLFSAIAVMIMILGAFIGTLLERVTKYFQRKPTTKSTTAIPTNTTSAAAVIEKKIK